VKKICRARAVMRYWSRAWLPCRACVFN